MEKTIKFVNFNDIMVACGKNHIGVYGEYHKIGKGLYLIYTAPDNKCERFHGTLEGVREYFTRLANL